VVDESGGTAAEGVHRWTVGGAVVEHPERGDLLLVRNVRRGGRWDWTPPGGVIEHHEDLLVGLGREVEEETGLQVRAWSGLLYEVRIEAVDLRWDLRVEVHRSGEVAGSLEVGDDPDGIVVDARWANPVTARDLLESTQPWVREPLLEWLDERWTTPRTFGFRVHGTDAASTTVERTA